MYRILFVDDDPNTLNGLKRMLHPMRNEWAMAFTANGELALKALEDYEFDVVVTDLKMPRVTGFQLLRRMRTQFPDVARIVLSGESERNIVLKIIGATHTYLAKPCDAENLKYAISRACALREMLRDRRLRTVITGLESVPSLPSIYREIKQAIQQEAVGVPEIAEIVSRDMGLSAAVLHIANSAWLGIPRRVASVKEAICFLGIDNLQAMILSTHMFSKLSEDIIRNLSLEGLWERSAQVAAYAQQIARFEQFSPREAATASMAGFLHTVGSLVLALNMPDRYRAAQLDARTKRIPIWQAEETVIGASHAQVGAYLLSLWGLPPGVVDAVAWLHRPDQYPSDSISSVVVVHVAYAFAVIRPGGSVPNPDAVIDAELLRRLHLDDKIGAWKRVCVEACADLAHAA